MALRWSIVISDEVVSLITCETSTIDELCLIIIATWPGSNDGRLGRGWSSCSE
jgi:hypothetical protein